jgi:hypothetical protein
MRQTRRPDAAGPAARGYAVTHPSGTVVLPTEPGWDQLVYASAGVMTVDTRAGTSGREVRERSRWCWKMMSGRRDVGSAVSEGAIG